MFGHGITVVSQGRPVHTFTDEGTAQGFVEANSTKVVKLQVGESLPRVLYEQHIKAHLPDLCAVHLVAQESIGKVGAYREYVDGLASDRKWRNLASAPAMTFELVE